MITPVNDDAEDSREHHLCNQHKGGVAMKRRSGIVAGILLILALLVLNEATAFSEAKFKWGPYLRLRHEYWRNVLDSESKDLTNEAKDNRNFFRIKAGAWAQADLTDWLSASIKLIDEFRAYTYYFQSTSKKKGYHFDVNELYFDNLYVDVKKVLNLPVDLRIGRQDFLGQYGESFLIGDGTPGDGSRSFYFNAAKASWAVDQNNSVDMIYITDPRDDTYLPVINEDKNPFNLNTTNEQGAVLYWKNKELVQDMNLEGYYIYKREDDEYGSGAQAQKGIINTFGSYAKYNMDPFTVRGQFCYQFGTYGLDDRQGYGGYAYIDRAFKDVAWNPVATIGYVYLSGDNPKTSKNESFDPLFSRFPNFFELYGYTIGNSKDQGVLFYWSNLAIATARVVVSPTKKMKLSNSYHFLWAPERLPVANRVYPYNNSGKNRGQLVSSQISYAFTKNITGYILGEYFLPGNFYNSGSDSEAFLRSQLELKF